MKTKFSLKHIGTARCSAALVALALILAAGGSQATGVNASVSTNSYGSGQQYKTTVERQSQGDLSAEDLHQASLLTSQLLTHVDKASQQLTDARPDSARSELEKAHALVKVVRGLLPTTMVTTTVKDAQGKEVYRDEQRVQEDQIPIYSGEIAMEVVEPIVEAKRDEAALKGVRLADAEMIHTAVLVDVNYVERKITRALELMAKPEQAATELALIHTAGVRFYAHKEDSPLVDVQHALRLAERMVREKKYDGAKINLQTAKLQLEAYRALVDTSASVSAGDLEKEIQKLSGELENPSAADKIRGMWDKVASWFKRESGQAHQTGAPGTNPAKTTEKANS